MYVGIYIYIHIHVLFIYLWTLIRRLDPSPSTVAYLLDTADSLSLVFVLVFFVDPPNSLDRIAATLIKYTNVICPEIANKVKKRQHSIFCIILYMLRATRPN